MTVIGILVPVILVNTPEVPEICIYPETPVIEVAWTMFPVSVLPEM